uniref:Uncharacterized protein n=1 Tax=Arundo donax TaxID=35708 RepID=A0A0A9C132_ARUDO
MASSRQLRRWLGLAAAVPPSPGPDRQHRPDPAGRRRHGGRGPPASRGSDGSQSCGNEKGLCYLEGFA